jgi:hypothetical protein
MPVLIGVDGRGVLSDNCLWLKVKAALYMQIWRASVAHIPDFCVSSLCWNLCPHEPGKINKGKKQMAAKFVPPPP